jgi:mono/diheme cytochrome c family protein
VKSTALNTSFLAALSLASLAGLSGCRGEPSGDPPIHLQRNMMYQERYNPQSYSEFFGDHRTMRTPVEGTVAQEAFEDSDEVATGRLADNSGYVLTIPQPVVERFGDTAKMLERGQQRYNIYCAPCHDKTGGGKGTVAMVQNGFPALPVFATQKYRAMPDGQVYATITNGVRNMPSYAAQVPVNDRWAIVSYVRALQLAQVSQASQPEPKK